MIIALGAVTISNFMSNTAAANLIVPLVVTIGAFSPVAGAVVVAFACSLAMSLPISTPPNAIAFATREITTRDMAKIGTIISIIGITILIGLTVILLKQYPVL
jgi:sodium-dependent dicarboxylate transporter 2/3/5